MYFATCLTDEKLYTNDGFSELVEILEDYDVELGALVKKMNED